MMEKKTIQFHSQIGVNYFWTQIFWLRTVATLTLPVSDIYFTQDRVSILTLNFKSIWAVRGQLWMASRAGPTHKSLPGILKQSLKMNERVHPQELKHRASPAALSISSPFSIIPLPLASSPHFVKELTWLLCIPQLNIVQTECVGGCSAQEWRTYGFPFWHPGCTLFWDETADTAHASPLPTVQ